MCNNNKASVSSLQGYYTGTCTQVYININPYIILCNIRPLPYTQ